MSATPPDAYNPLGTAEVVLDHIRNAVGPGSRVFVLAGNSLAALRQADRDGILRTRGLLASPCRDALGKLMGTRIDHAIILGDEIRAAQDVTLPGAMRQALSHLRGRMKPDASITVLLNGEPTVFSGAEGQPFSAVFRGISGRAGWAPLDEVVMEMLWPTPPAILADPICEAALREDTE